MAIKKRRNTLKITEPSLADLAKISVNTLYKIERVTTNPTIEVLEKLCNVLGLQFKLDVKNNNQ